MNIDDRIKEAYANIDSAQNYRIPKLQELRLKTKRKMTACSLCGAPFFRSYDGNPNKCPGCRKKIADRNRKKAHKTLAEKLVSQKHI